MDLVDERWDAGAGALTGTSRVVAGDPYEVRIVAGAGEKAWKAGKAELVGAPTGATVSVARDGPHVRVTVTSPETGEVRWRVGFSQ